MDEIKTDLREYSEDALSLEVFNSEYLYTERHHRTFLFTIDELFLYTNDQLDVLKQDLADDLKEEELS